MEENKNLSNDKKIQKFDKRNFYTNDDSGKVFIFALLLPQILVFVMTIMFGWVGELGRLIISAFIAPISFVVVYFCYNKLCNVSFKASTIQNKLGWKNILLSIFIAVLALFGLLFLINGLDVFLESVLKYKLQDTVLPNDNVGWLILNLFVLAALPAVCEEFIFRGVILQGLRKNFSDLKAILLCGLLFALMHTSLQQLVYPFLLGIILSWICLRTSSLRASIIVHFVNNAIVVLLDFFNAEAVFEFRNVWWYYLVMFGAVIVLGVVLWLIDKFYFKKKNQNEIEKDRVTHMSVFIIVGIVIAIVLLGCMTLISYLTPVAST